MLTQQGRLEAILVALLASTACVKEKSKQESNDLPDKPRSWEVTDTGKSPGPSGETEPNPPGSTPSPGSISVSLLQQGSLHPFDSLRLGFAGAQNLQLWTSRIEILLDQRPIGFDIAPINSDKILTLRPHAPLTPGGNYQIIVRAPDDEDLLLKTDFAVATPIGFTVLVAGHDLADGSVQLDRHDHPDVELEVRTESGPHVRLQSVVLESMSDGSSQFLCQEAACQTQDSFVIAPLAVSTGLNAFALKAKDEDGHLSTHTFSFGYGDLVTEAAKGKKIPQSLNTFIDQKVGLAAFADLLQRYTSQQYKLTFPGFDRPVIFDEIVNLRRDDSSNDGRNCLLNRERLDQSYNVDYITSIGPFCDIAVDFKHTTSFKIPIFGNMDIDVSMRGTSDIYFTGFARVDDPNNTIVKFTARDKNLFDSALDAKTFSGSYTLVVKVTEVKPENALLNFFNQVVPSTDLLKGIYVVKGSFGMNSPEYRHSAARSTLGFTPDGLIDFSINSFDDPRFDQENPFNQFDLVGPQLYRTHFDSREWAAAVRIAKPTYEKKLTHSNGFVDDWFKTMVVDAVAAAIENLKGLATNLMLGDLVARVSPEVINQILKELDQGAELGLPSWSPHPLNNLELVAAARMSPGVRSIQPDPRKDGGLLTQAKAGVTAQAKDQSSAPQAPEAPLTGDSWILPEKMALPPSPLTYEDPQNPGILVSMNSAPFNQALYHAWKQGFGALTIDRAFAGRHKEATGDQRLMDIIDQLMKPRVLLALLDDSQDHSDGPRGERLQVPEEAQVKIEIATLSPPHVSILRPEQKEVPKIRAQAALQIGITLTMADGTDLKILQADGWAETTAQARFFANEGPRGANQGPLAFQLTVSSDPEDLRFHFTLDQSINPYGLDLRRSKETLDDLVTSLFLPILNQVTESVPMPRLEGCGMRIDAIDLVAIEPYSANIEPWLLVRLPISTFPFKGVCTL